MRAVLASVVLMATVGMSTFVSLGQPFIEVTNFPGPWEGPFEWGDFDNDGRLDLYAPATIYRNFGNGTFTELTGTGLPSVLFGRALFGRPESSILDLPNLLKGFGFTLDAMWAEVSKLNLLKRVPALKMPVVIFVGRRDHWVPPETSVAFFDALAAPSKDLVWFEHSGHEAFVDEPEKFNSTMVELVRPLALLALIPESPAAQLPVSA